MKLNISLLVSFCVFILATFDCNDIQGQVNHPNPVNNYVSFANESTHGLLIAHRILEGFNQKVNAFVDLQSNQLNFYGNKDLPKDLFEDPEHWFYPISPNSWYKIIESTNWDGSEKGQLDLISAEMHSICQRVNQMRFDLENYILENDLTETQSQVQIFELLQVCTSLYDRYYEANNQLHTICKNLIDQEVNKSDKKENYFKLQVGLKSAMEIIKFGYGSELAKTQSILIAENTVLQNTLANDKRLSDMQSSLQEGLQIIESYQNQKNIPDKYRLYGAAYYYHNVELAAIVNRYGKGFVNNANKILFEEDPNQVLLLEEPHYFKVVLPLKDIPMEATAEIIQSLPSALKERKVTIAQTKIQVNEKKILLEIFDHRQEDGDIVSLNFNGRWILKERVLTKAPLKMIIELNDEGENYLLLHAENLGSIPPNTIAIRYYIEGARKTVVLNSDLNQSEMIRIERINKE